MLNIRILVLSVVVMLILTGAAFSAVSASPAAVPAAFDELVCPVNHSTYLSTQELTDILNGRYEHRVGLPR